MGATVAIATVFVLASCSIINDRFRFEPAEAGVDGGTSMDGGARDAGAPTDGGGQDSGPVPCEVLSAPTNGAIDRTSGSTGDIATYSCDSGFYLLGNAGSLTRTCQADGTWTGSTPTCEYTGGYPLSPIPGTPGNARSYEIQTDTVLDRVTGLEWQRAVDPGSFSWSGARDFCDTLPLDGKNDWRLPTRSELRSLVASAIDPAAFPSTPVAFFWYPFDEPRS